MQRDVRAELAAGGGTGDPPGITGTFGIIKRSDGSAQATFDGYPLYTFVGDTAPGLSARPRATASARSAGSGTR
jgi:Secreted repeat of unknown function